MRRVRRRTGRPADRLTPVAIVVLTALLTLAVSAVASRIVVPESNAAQFPAGVPGAPVIDDIIESEGALIVLFDPPAVDEEQPITGYEYSTDYGVSWRVRAPSSNPLASPLVITTTSADNEPLANNTIYQVRIRAVNAVGVGFPSNMVEAGVITVSIVDLDDTNTTFTNPIVGMVPGDQGIRYVNAQNPPGGFSTWSALGIRARVTSEAGGEAAGLWASPANVPVLVEFCSAQYTYPATCGGEWVPAGVLGVGTQTYGEATMVDGPLPATGGSIGLRFTWYMCTAANAVPAPPSWTQAQGVCAGTANPALQGSTSTYLVELLVQ